MKNESILKVAKNGHNAKAIAHAKYSVLVKKNAAKKQLIFEKWERFKNGEKWPQCKGDSPCKMVTLGQN